MDKSRIGFSFIWSKAFSKPIPKLSGALAEIYRKLLTTTTLRSKLTPFVYSLMGVIFLVLALAIGFRAHQVSGQEYLSAWFVQNTPSEKLITDVLNAQGFQKILDPKKIHNCLRLMRVNWDEKGSFWITENGDWIVVFPLAKEENRIVVFSRNPKAPPERLTRWDRMETQGWSALQEAITRADATSRKATNFPIVPRKISQNTYLDTRQIRY
jgi:hypothetical protein